MTDFTHVFVEAGNLRNIIDAVHPATERGIYSGETLDEVRQRYPTAERLAFDIWQTRKAAAQDTPIQWLETTREQYNDMLGVLPPAYHRYGDFLVGEPDDHHAITGAPRYRAYREWQGQFFVSSRPMTVRELKEAHR